MTRTFHYCPYCGNPQPNWPHFYLECFILIFIIGPTIWPFYLFRPYDYFRDMYKQYIEIKYFCLGLTDDKRLFERIKRLSPYNLHELMLTVDLNKQYQNWEIFDSIDWDLFDPERVTKFFITPILTESNLNIFMKIYGEEHSVLKMENNSGIAIGIYELLNSEKTIKLLEALI